MFDTVICLSSASLSSELITISSHAFSCSKDRIHSLCSCNLFACFGKPFTFDSMFKQKGLSRLRLTFFARSSSSIDSLALVLSLDTLPILFHPVVLAFRWASKSLLKASGHISARNCRYSLRCFFMWSFVTIYNQDVNVARNHEKNLMRPLFLPDLHRYGKYLARSLKQLKSPAVINSVYRFRRRCRSPRSIATLKLCLLPRWSPCADDRVIRSTEFLPHPILSRGLTVPGTTPSVPSTGMGIPHV